MAIELERGTDVDPRKPIEAARCVYSRLRMRPQAAYDGPAIEACAIVAYLIVARKELRDYLLDGRPNSLQYL